MQDEINRQQSLPSLIPTTVNDIESDVFLTESVTSSPPPTPAEPGVRQKPISGTQPYRPTPSVHIALKWNVLNCEIEFRNLFLFEVDCSH